MSEPRVTIRNVATGNILFVGSSWNAITTSEDKAADRDAMFKVQWRERTSQEIATVVVIRTDCHPQSLLDARDLQYQGGALDPNKCFDQNRWWKLTWLKLAKQDRRPTVLISSYSKGTYLAEKKNGVGVELISLRGDVNMMEVSRAKWELSIGGRALSTHQAAVLGVGVPIAVVAGLITGGAAVAAAAGPMATILAGSGATTLAGAVGTSTAIVTGAAVGGISAASTTVICNALKDVSNTLFVDW